MKRVVITGLGTVNPLGLTNKETWQNVLKGEQQFSYYEPLGVVLSRVDDAFKTKLSPRDLRYQDRVTQLSVLSTREAIEDSGLDEASLNQAILSIGTSIGGINTTIAEVEQVTRTSMKAIGVRTVTKILPNMIAANLSIAFGIKGPSLTYCEACASSSVSLGEAFEKLRNGRAEVAVVVGTEACLNDNVVEAFRKLRVLSGQTDTTKASLPFMKERNGFVMSEGAATLVLETLEHATNRGATIYGEIKGYGNTSDAHSLVAPDSQGMEGAMKQALEQAALTANEIHYINAHGTATQGNDANEAQAISRLFDNPNTKLSSTKALFGHLLGGAGALEALLCMNMLANRTLIKQYGIDDNTIDTDDKVKTMLLTQNLPPDAETKPITILSNSFAFGGVNSSLVFSEVADL